MCWRKASHHWACRVRPGRLPPQTELPAKQQLMIGFETSFHVTLNQVDFPIC